MEYMGEENEVYYYIGCRFIGGPVSPNYLEKIKAKSDSLQDKVRL